MTLLALTDAVASELIQVAGVVLSTLFLVMGGVGIVRGWTSPLSRWLTR